MRELNRSKEYDISSDIAEKPALKIDNIAVQNLVLHLEGLSDEAFKGGKKESEIAISNLVSAGLCLIQLKFKEAASYLLTIAERHGEDLLTCKATKSQVAIESTENFIACSITRLALAANKYDLFDKWIDKVSDEQHLIGCLNTILADHSRSLAYQNRIDLLFRIHSLLTDQDCIDLVSERICELLLRQGSDSTGSQEKAIQLAKTMGASAPQVGYMVATSLVASNQLNEAEEILDNLEWNPDIAALDRVALRLSEFLRVCMEKDTEENQLAYHALADLISQLDHLSYPLTDWRALSSKILMCQITESFVKHFIGSSSVHFEEFKATITSTIEHASDILDKSPLNSLQNAEIIFKNAELQFQVGNISRAASELLRWVKYRIACTVDFESLAGQESRDLAASELMLAVGKQLHATGDKDTRNKDAEWLEGLAVPLHGHLPTESFIVFLPSILTLSTLLTEPSTAAKIINNSIHEYPPSLIKRAIIAGQFELIRAGQQQETFEILADIDNKCLATQLLSSAITIIGKNFSTPILKDEKLIRARDSIIENLDYNNIMDNREWQHVVTTLVASAVSLKKQGIKHSGLFLYSAAKEVISRRIGQDNTTLEAKTGLILSHLSNVAKLFDDIKGTELYKQLCSRAHNSYDVSEFALEQVRLGQPDDAVEILSQFTKWELLNDDPVTLNYSLDKSENTSRIQEASDWTPEKEEEETEDDVEVADQRTERRYKVVIETLSELLISRFTDQLHKKGLAELKQLAPTPEHEFGAIQSLLNFACYGYF